MNCAVLAVLAVLCCCCALRADARPARLRSRPLDNSETWNNVMVMAKHAQAQDRDHETRLIPVISSDKLKDGDVCCVNVKILDYYLRHILDSQAREHHYPRLHLVKPDLVRVARDLEPHCNSKQVDLEHLQTFTQNLKRAGEMYKNNTKAQNKAIGELDILFHYLYESCSATSTS
ncbi:interleukin-22 [Pangasianodon hypophthalmus]|uniref:interleukin-22 n=1 Tax=Pangasianodon hypophthalmus TaxID=310915 RepID=UPI00147AFD05|nr:interleukin-22 [Pangasianodon hypophthalmus]